MRFVFAALAAASLFMAAPARASERCRFPDPAERESGPDAYLLWTHPHAAAAGGFRYDEPGLTCTPVVHRRHYVRHVWRRPRHRVRVASARPGWVNVPLENVGGRCPMGDCFLLMDEMRRHPT